MNIDPSVRRNSGLAELSKRVDAAISTRRPSTEPRNESIIRLRSRRAAAAGHESAVKAAARQRLDDGIRALATIYSRPSR